METQKKFELGPALAIVIVLGAVALAGIYFYKIILEQTRPIGPSAQVVPVQVESRNTNNGLAPLTEQSSSVEPDDISADIEADLQADFGTGFIEDLESSLLEFEELEDFDFTL